MFEGPYGFGAQGYLLFLVLAPICAAIIGWWLAWRRDARLAFGGLPHESRRRRIATIAAPALIVAAIAIAAFASARPQYGEREVRAEQKGIDLAIVLDVSSSMLATDSEPSRLGRAQSEIDALLDRMDGDRVGLVIFAGNSFVRAPLTTDLRALRGIVDGVARERALVRPGSDLGGAIRTAQALVRGGNAETRAMLIVSDGEDHGTTIAQAVTDARAANLLIYTAGAGTSEGAPVLDVDPRTGNIGPRIGAGGQIVLTKRDEAALRTIAQNGAARYVALSGEGRPLASLAAEFDSLARTSFGLAPARQLDERFQIFAILALILVLVEFYLPSLATPRSAGRSALRLLPMLGGVTLVAAICSTSVADINRRGNGAYNAGDYASSITSYKTAEARAPSRAELYHNAGNAYDQQQDFARAIDETKRAPEPASSAIAARIAYALGNHYAGATQLRDALEAYKRALLADPADADAKHNLEQVIRRLTPSPTPTQTSAPPEGTPTPNPNSTPDGNAGGTPPAGGTTHDAPGTPGAGDRQLTEQEVQQALAEALRGLDRNFTPDEALRALDLLDRRNQQAIEDLANAAPPNALPDY